MTDLQAIEIRKSRRSYLQAPISQEHIALLTATIKNINTISGLNVELLEDGSDAFRGLRRNYGLFQGVRSLIVLKGNKSDISLKEKAGYYGEKIVLEATKLGLGTCWVGGTYQRGNAVFNLADQEELVCVVTIGNVGEMYSMKEKVIFGLMHRKTKSAETLYEADPKPPQWFLDGISAVQKAPTAVNSQKFRFSYNNGKVTAYVPDTAGFDLVDLGIGKLHFETGAGNGRFETGNYGLYVIEKNG